MGRHSGFFLGLCLVSTLFAGRFAVALKEVIPSIAADRPALSFGKPVNMQSSAPGRVRTFCVPPNSLIVVTSLDPHGGRHTFEMRARLSDSLTPGNCHSPSRESRGTKAGPVSCEEPGSKLATAEGHLLEALEVVSESQCPESGRHRRFLAPRYGAAGVFDALVTAKLILADERVALYVDMTLPTERQEAVLASSRDLSPQLVSGILRAVSERLGTIHDLDHDGRLAILITELDCQKDEQSVPVLGCVRPTDFLALSSEEGDTTVLTDVVYLDDGFPSGNDLTALLAHEIAHAAVYCRLHDRQVNQQVPLDLPEWLHEGIAHHLEFILAEKTQVYSERLEQFHRTPHRFPVCASPLISSRSERRGGSRAAVSRFLQFALRPEEDWCRWLSEAESVNQFLTLCLADDLDDLLPEWSLREAVEMSRFSVAAVPEVVSEQRVSREILGTAFTVVKSGEHAIELDIHCMDDSPWDVRWISLPVDSRLTERPAGEAGKQLR